MFYLAPPSPNRGFCRQIRRLRVWRELASKRKSREVGGVAGDSGKDGK